MQSPYELKDLGQKIVALASNDGLHLAEGAVESLAKASYIGLKSWLKESADLSSNPIDDVVVRFTDYADAFLMTQIEKLDLDKDGK